MVSIFKGFLDVTEKKRAGSAAVLAAFSSNAAVYGQELVYLYGHTSTHYGRPATTIHGEENKGEQRRSSRHFPYHAFPPSLMEKNSVPLYWTQINSDKKWVPELINWITE